MPLYEIIDEQRDLPLIILKLWSRILYHDLYVTGSQCNCSKTGLACSLFWVRVTSRTAQFCILCRRLTTAREMPNTNSLPKANLEITRAWTKFPYASVVTYRRQLPKQRIWLNQLLLVWNCNTILGRSLTAGNCSGKVFNSQDNWNISSKMLNLFLTLLLTIFSNYQWYMRLVKCIQYISTISMMYRFTRWMNTFIYHGTTLPYYLVMC